MSNMEKRKFIVTETRPAIQIWTYEVEAEDEEDAISQVENRDVDSFDYSVEEDSPFTESTFEAQEQL